MPKKKIFPYFAFFTLGFILGALSILGLFLYKSSGFKENLFISSSSYIFGIDVSAYQGNINWSEVRSSHHPIEFVFIRASMGKDGIDDEFNVNWEACKQQEFLRGAYHYYRPNENSSDQFNNFKNHVTLVSGDLPPVLDIEKESQFGNDNLVKGVQNWLDLAEAHYNMKPILYTGLDFYNQNLKGKISTDYPLWIAAYSGKKRVKHLNWTFHQFTENVKVKGIKNTVDGNDFRGSITELQALKKP